MIPKQDAQKIANTLNAKGANKPCARCGGFSSSVREEGYFSFAPTERMGDVVMGGGIPCAVVVCNNCGAVTFHAVGTLGLLPNG